MIRIPSLKPFGLFLVPKSSFTEYLKPEAVYAHRLEKKVSCVSSPSVTKLRKSTKQVVYRDIVRSLVGVLGRKQAKTWRILDYLAAQKSKETVAQYCTDLELSWNTVLRASEGNPDPWNFSFWMFFGKTYPRALKAWAERDEINRKALERCAKLVREQQAVRLTVPEGKSEGHKNESRLPLYESAHQVLAQKKPRAA